MASYSGTLYVGMTGNLENRVAQHKRGQGCLFTKKYQCKKLVYFEECEERIIARKREREVKKWSRGKKVQLIVSINLHWKDLAV